VSEKSTNRDRAAEERANKRSSWAGGDDFPLFDTESASSAQPLFKAPEPVATPSSSKSEPHSGNVSVSLAISTSELCLGATKYVDYRCKLEDNLSGVVTLFDQVAKVEILPGLRFDKRVTLPGYGNYVPQLRSRGDLVVLLTRKPEDRFEVEHRDVILPIEISVYESIVGFKKTVKTVCGQEKTYASDKCTPHGTELLVRGFGLPKFEGKGKPPGKRGDMVLKVEVVWPTGELDSTRKALLKQALGEPGYRSPRRRH
jgi:DnaJ family protein B protein 4